MNIVCQSAFSLESQLTAQFFQESKHYSNEYQHIPVGENYWTKANTTYNIPSANKLSNIRNGVSFELGVCVCVLNAFSD